HTEIGSQRLDDQLTGYAHPKISRNQFSENESFVFIETFPITGYACFFLFIGSLREVGQLVDHLWKGESLAGFRLRGEHECDRFSEIAHDVVRCFKKPARYPGCRRCPSFEIRGFYGAPWSIADQ